MSIIVKTFNCKSGSPLISMLLLLQLTDATMCFLSFIHSMCNIKNGNTENYSAKTKAYHKDYKIMYLWIFERTVTINIIKILIYYIIISIIHHCTSEFKPWLFSVSHANYNSDMFFLIQRAHPVAFLSFLSPYINLSFTLILKYTISWQHFRYIKYCSNKSNFK